METKFCTKCEKTKPLSKFYKKSNYKGGYSCWCKICEKECAQRNYKGYQGRKRETDLQRKYGITLEEYDLLLGLQGNGCAICGKTPEENGKRLYVDHDHKTDEVRGLLCFNCNIALGYLKDSPELCRLAMLYLQRMEK